MELWKTEIGAYERLADKVNAWYESRKEKGLVREGDGVETS